MTWGGLTSADTTRYSPVSISSPLQEDGPNSWRITLTAAGIHYPLRLVPSSIVSVSLYNDALPQAHPLRQNSSLELLSGTVEGDPTSWARVTLENGQLTGHVFTFGELLKIESTTKLLHTLEQPDTPSKRLSHSSVHYLKSISDSGQYPTVISKSPSLAELPLHPADRESMPRAIDYQLFAPTAATTEQSAPPTSASNSIEQFISRANARLSPRTVPRAIRIGIVVDSRFDEFHQGQGVARALSIINSVDGIYQQQLGIAIVVDAIRANINPATDPMRNRGGTIDEILNSFRLVRLTDDRLAADLTMVHLFTGLRDPDSVIGLGWINTACRTDGYDVSVSTPFTFDTLLTAHEMAHNLGALHDDHPTCATDRSHIMWPRLSGKTTNAFSACSKTAIAPSINASCNLDNIDLSVGLQSALTTVEGQRAVTMRLRNNDASRTARSVALLARLPVGSTILDTSAFCLASGAELRCEIGDVPPGSITSATARVTLNTNSSAQNAQLSILDGDYADTITNNNNVSLDIREAGSTGSSSVANSLQNDPLENNGNQLSAQNGGSAGGQPRTGATGVAMLLVLMTAVRLRRKCRAFGV